MSVEIHDRTGDVLIAVRGIAEKKLRQFAEKMVLTAKSICPVDTGNLKRSIDFRPIEPLTVEVFTDTAKGDKPGYGAFVEFGTVKQTAQPYMAPAFDAARSVLEGSLT